MQTDAITAVRPDQASGAASSRIEAYQQTLSDFPLAGAHLTLSAPKVGDPAVQGSLSLREFGKSISPGMSSSFTAKPMADMVSAANRGDTYGMTMALASLTQASNTVALLGKMGAQVSQGIKTLTTQGG